ncbi:hypothetical protein Cri9333_1235 [Crinalium epipsammum PCC 9333]|uniref:NYN domain-containing protein n=1 Tax=Crinalium epipsammum PCC 9333 TaxID=1173022 RepID=K9VW00_9CYAN|nr:NYN domain-containing protein [Crinalium epipsammum]AFZ12136.1 hypothetical protein Cri9333_1235 [Crinalium epipsammum PCC 9333]
MTEINDPAIINLIAQNVYQTLVDIQRINPSLLKEKYRQFPWRSRQADFIKMLTLELSETIDIDTLILKLIKLLNRFINYSFFISEQYKNLTEKLRQITKISPNIELSKLSSDAESEQAIAILLLDLENLQLDIATENFIAQVCTYPIQVKIAFANWRQMGKLDAELHSRGYDLIHVPAGKDNADGKMIAVGLSLREHYPNAKEVLVCSSDNVMTNLCNHLLKKGLTVYRVSRQKDGLIISNFQTNKTHKYTLSQLPALPPLAECLNNLRSLIAAEQNKNKTQWIKASKISALFLEKYKYSLEKVAVIYLHSKQVKDLFIGNPSIFAIHQPAPDNEIYITVFNSKNESQLIENNSSNTDNSKITQPLHQIIESSEQLELALVSLLEHTNKKSSINSIKLITIAQLGILFRQRYNKSVREVLKKIGKNGNLTKFLQSSGKFTTQIINQIEYVELASDPILTLNSPTALEQVLVKIFKSLTLKSPQSQIPVETLSGEFHKRYGVTISAMMKHLKIAGSFTEFLQSCNTLEIKTSGTKSQVLLT